MNLIAYSDSEESDNEAPQVQQPLNKAASKTSFQKVVDRSNPGKIKLSLPTALQAQAQKDDDKGDGPPAKKARLTGGAFSGFNSMLPAPKKPNANAAIGAQQAGKRGLGKGLGSGVNLKTGAEPAFRRESRIEEEYDENGNPLKKPNQTPLQKDDFRALLNLSPPKTEAQMEMKHVRDDPKLEPVKPEYEVKPATKPKFMPLSVARGKKKKPIVPRSGTTNVNAEKPNAAPSTQESVLVDARPKVSLFSPPQTEEVAPVNTSSGGRYQPLLYAVEDEDDAAVPDDAFDEPNNIHQGFIAPSTVQGSQPGHQNLTDIASELNLTEAEKRQLFGRKGRGPDLSSANFVEFNTDQEYAHNELLRQQGETVQHNALKSISGTGKNSLRSLINVASTQKDALEEHFASGRRNKKEAGNKYGW